MRRTKPINFMALEKLNFNYHDWLKRKIQGMKEALNSNQSFEHMSGEMLERKLASYEKALKDDKNKNNQNGQI